MKNRIKEVLELFEIDEQQILSICVDNAAYMTCAVNKLNDHDEYPEENNTEDNNTALDISQEWDQDPGLILPSRTNDNTKIRSMRCGTHTLTLSIWDGFRS